MRQLNFLASVLLKLDLVKDRLLDILSLHDLATHPKVPNTVAYIEIVPPKRKMDFFSLLLGSSRAVNISLRLSSFIYARQFFIRIACVAVYPLFFFPLIVDKF